LNTVILASPDQYGYFTIYYNYAKYLSREFNVIYICFDQGEIKFKESEKIKVVYVELAGNKILRILKYYNAIVRIFKSNTSSKLILKYYFFSSLLNLFLPRKNLILDIRTGYTSLVRFKTFFFNSIIRIEAFPFKRIITLSESLREKLKLQIKKTIIIPLGADQIVSQPKIFDKLVLLYIGTLTSRNIGQTIEGLAQFIKNEGKNMEIEYYIVGGGKPLEVKELNDTINNNDLQNTVHYVGQVYGEKLKWFFLNCNIGVSYIPMIRDYDCQPATKTIEYLMAGMPVLATNTYENKVTVNENNGVLIKDTSEDFCIGLSTIYNKRNSFKSSEIRKSVESLTWENIINTNLKPYLLGLIEN
jgi:glycosyltransferase involved in cell wall biosynthesis